MFCCLPTIVVTSDYLHVPTNLGVYILVRRNQPEQSSLSETSAEPRLEKAGREFTLRRKLSALALISGAVAAGAMLNSDVRDGIDSFVYGEKTTEFNSLNAALCNPVKTEAIEIPFNAEGEVAWMAERVDGEKVAYVDRYIDDGKEVDRLPRAVVESAYVAPVVCESTDSKGVVSARTRDGKLKVLVDQDNLNIRVNAYNSSAENMTNIEGTRLQPRDRLVAEQVDSLRKMQANPEVIEKVRNEFNHSAGFEVVNDKDIQSQIETAYQDFIRESLIKQVKEKGATYDEIEVSFKGSMDLEPPIDFVPDVVIPEDTLRVERTEGQKTASKISFGPEATSE